MFRAMVLKELREIRGIVLLALVVYTLMLIAAIAPNLSGRVLPLLSLLSVFRNRQETLVPLVNDVFVVWYYLASAVLAIVMGLSQTLSESIRGTYPFLLHRPVTHGWLIGMKLAVGMVAYLICAAVPLLVYVLWAATPGTHAGPFEWSMSWPAWAGWFATTLLYLGAFLTGIRPGRWYASRLLPLVAAGLGIAVALGLSFAFRQAPLWVCLAVLAADAWMISAFFFVTQTRDFS